MKTYKCPDCGNEEERVDGFWMARCSKCDTVMDEVRERE